MALIKLDEENKDEIFFNLLENNFSAEERVELLAKIAADPVLDKQWKLWQELIYEDPIEPYKAETDFFENLLLPSKSKRKRGWFTFFLLLTLIGLTTLLMLFFPKHASSQKESKSQITKTQNTGIYLDKSVGKNNLAESTSKTKYSDSADKKEAINKMDTTIAKENISSINNPSEELMIEANNFRDSMVKFYQQQIEKDKTKKYKVTIVQENVGQEDLALLQAIHRYTMADIENGKDGITIRKFMNASKTRIVRDAITQQTYLEIYTTDNYVLEIALYK